MAKNDNKAVNVSYTIRDKRGFLQEKKRKFSTFTDAISFVKNKNPDKDGNTFHSKPVIY